MKITHFGHACVLFEAPGARLLFDPGAYASGFEELRDLDAILFTHEHPDHLDTERLPALLNANPDVQVITNPGGGERLREAGVNHHTVNPGDTVEAGESTVKVLGGDHAVIHRDLPCLGNNGYLVTDLLLHPGDAFVVPDDAVRVLLLPAGGPWMKVSESIDYLRSVAPQAAVPIHQAGLADVHQQLHYQLFRGLAPSGTEIHVLDHGVTTDF
ncbi:MBL fold metallo-hydrolase [Spirillospora sp. NPDC048819]|uniref:MBL fold metallo-hydrolase n=1 Tax=Spirillospora sp. NPDC048819 TaxID=3155268 RepID=UPI0033CEC8F6